MGKYANSGVKGGKILVQGLAKEMGAMPKALREKGPCELSGGSCVRVLPDESKEKIGVMV